MYLERFRLTGRNAVITGGGRGIGSAEDRCGDELLAARSMRLDQLAHDRQRAAVDVAQQLEAAHAAPLAGQTSTSGFAETSLAVHGETNAADVLAWLKENPA